MNLSFIFKSIAKSRALISTFIFLLFWAFMSALILSPNMSEEEKKTQAENAAFMAAQEKAQARSHASDNPTPHSASKLPAIPITQGVMVSQAQQRAQPDKNIQYMNEAKAVFETVAVLRTSAPEDIQQGQDKRNASDMTIQERPEDKSSAPIKKKINFEHTGD